jgi:predicted phage replisome organizer
MAKKYYWLKLQKDFFKNHHIKIIEGMANGTDYILFYMKLLVESISHEGRLRFSDRVPYNDSMLSTITDTNIDIVRSAVKIFTELDLMTLEDDGTIFMV